MTFVKDISRYERVNGRPAEISEIRTLCWPGRFQDDFVDNVKHFLWPYTDSVSSLYR